jgi:hypothetical protein
MSDLSLSWGTTKPVNIAVTLGVGGAPVNLTGKSLKLMVKYRHEDADAQAIISLANGSGITYTDATNGLAQALFLPSHTSALDAGKIYDLVYDVRLIDGSNAYTVAGGKFTVGRVVVRATS